MVESNSVNLLRNQRDSGPVGVVSSIVGGFDRVAANPILLLPVILLDLFLWLGPHLRITSLVEDVFNILMSSPGIGILTPDQTGLIEEMADVFAERFNVFSTLSTLPAGMPFNLMFLLLSAFLIGIPSLMAVWMPVETPLGPPVMVDLANPPVLLITWIGLAVIGLGLGSMFHHYLAGRVDPGSRIESIGKIWIKILILAVLGYVVLMVFFSGLVLIASESGLMYIGFPIAFVAGIYLAFTPHGIVQYRLGIWEAIKASVNMVRKNFFSATGFLFIAFFLIWLTTTQVWLLPDETSWFTALAILGHAFVTATLLAASYVYYQGRQEWMFAREAERRRIELSLEPPGPSDPGKMDDDEGV